MAGGKKNSAKWFSPGWFRRLLAGPTGRRAVAWTLAVTLLSGGAWAVWLRVRDRVVGGPEYTFDPRTMIVTPQPNWIRRDLKADVIRDASLDAASLSMLDDDLTRRVADAFRLQPWIARVERVEKRYPAEVRVDVIYRRPVAMVVVSGGLLPVDVTGVHLPTGDFTEGDAAGYLRVTGIATLPVGAAGSPWGDPRVASAAELAGALSDVWRELGLYEIAAAAPANNLSSIQTGVFTLATKQGTKFLWGHAPSGEQAGEMLAADKIERLKKFVAEHGSLDANKGPGDLWSERPAEVSSRPDKPPR